MNRVLVHCFIWRCRHFCHHRIIIITSSYRCRDTIPRLSAMGLVRIQTFNRDWQVFFFTPPLPSSPYIPSRLLCIKSWLSRRISFENSSWSVYAFSDLKGMGVQGLHPVPSVRTLLFQQYLISRDSTFPFLDRIMKKRKLEVAANTLPHFTTTKRI